MASESIIWLSHRLGPVLTARYVTRNLLRMITLCYLHDDALQPYNGPGVVDSLHKSYIRGDVYASKVINCLASISGMEKFKSGAPLHS